MGWGAEYQRGKIDRRTARLFGTARLFLSHTHSLSRTHTLSRSHVCARDLSLSRSLARARACAHMTGDYKDMEISPLAKAVSKTVAQVSKRVEETSGQDSGLLCSREHQKGTSVQNSDRDDFVLVSMCVYLCLSVWV